MTSRPTATLHSKQIEILRDAFRRQTWTDYEKEQADRLCDMALASLSETEASGTAKPDPCSIEGMIASARPSESKEQGRPISEYIDEQERIPERKAALDKAREELLRPSDKDDEASRLAEFFEKRGADGEPLRVTAWEAAIISRALQSATPARDTDDLARFRRALQRIAITDDADCAHAKNPEAMKRIAREALNE